MVPQLDVVLEQEKVGGLMKDLLLPLAIPVGSL